MRFLITLIPLFAIGAVIGIMTHTTTLDAPAPAASVPADEASAAVKVAYALATVPNVPLEVDPFQDRKPVLPAKNHCQCSGPENCTCAPGECECSACAKTQALKDRCKCSGPQNCTCAPGKCECPACIWTEKVYHITRQGKTPVAVWVGQQRQPVLGVLCYHTNEDYAATPRPGVILLEPEGGCLVVVKRFSGTPTAADVQAALAPRPVAATPSVPVYSLPLTPNYPMFAPSFRGGFGGGACRGGG